MLTVSSATIGVSISWDGGNTYTSEKTILYTFDNAHWPNVIVGSVTFTDSDRIWSGEDFSNANLRVKIRLVSKAGLANGVACDYVGIEVTGYNAPMKLEGCLHNSRRVLSG